MNVRITDKIATWILYIISGAVVLLLVSFVGYIIIQGSSAINFNFLFGNPKVGEAGGGIGPQLFNSFYLLFLSLLITIPFGVGAGIYLSQYAKEGTFLNIIRLSIETMSSLPSIVVGLFGLLVFVISFKMGYSLLAGALAITVLNLPSMTRVSETAITTAAKSVKEASLALGATEWQTIKKVILPSAIPQILTGVILAAGRIFGEAAALLYTAGMSTNMLNFKTASLVGKSSAFSVMRPAETLAVHIWKVNSESMVPDAARVANGSAAVLVIMVLLFNFTARYFGKKLYYSYTGKR